MASLQDLATALQNIAANLGRLIAQTSLAVVIPIGQGGTGATTAAGARANLGVPEITTGAWTPALQFGGAGTGISYGQQVGAWTLIGSEMTCRFTITLTSVGSATGAAAIGGLPVASNANVANAGAAGVCPLYASMASITGAILASVGAASSAAALVEFGAAAQNALTNANFTNTAQLSGSFTYMV